jgi:phage anti-repressor protein
MSNMMLADSNVDLQSLVAKWIEDEKNGEQFPVDFDIAWYIAGYATKASAKRALMIFFIEKEDYLFNRVLKSTGGRASEVYYLSCDAFKELCMLSKSEVGKNTRKYFIEAEKALMVAQSISPQMEEKLNEALLKIEETAQKIDAFAKQITVQQIDHKNSVINYVNAVQKLERIKDPALKKNLTERIKAELGVTELDEFEAEKSITKSQFDLLLDKIFEIAEKKADWVAPRDISIQTKLKGQRLYSKDIKIAFEELANQGKGEIKQTARTLKFKIYPDSALTKIIYH